MKWQISIYLNACKYIKYIVKQAIKIYLIKKRSLVLRKYKLIKNKRSEDSTNN